MSGVGGAAPAVVAVVVGRHGSARSASALASVAWAAERLLLDPAETPIATGLPGATAAPWLLLLGEDETVPAPLAAELARVTATGWPRPYRIAQELHGPQGTLRLRGAPVRLAARAGARLVLGPGLALGLAAASPVGRLVMPLAREAGNLTTALEQLESTTTTLAHLLAARDAPPRIRHLVPAALAAGGRVVAGRAPVRLGWGRCILAALAAYEPVVAYAKLWELDRRRAVIA